MILVALSATAQVPLVNQGLAGVASGTLTITDNAAKNPQKVALAGEGTVITISPVAVNFSDETVGSMSSVEQITLTNPGTSAVSIGAIGLTGTNSGDFKTANNRGKSVAMNGTCIIKVAFKTTASGAQSASVTMTDNGGGSPQTVALTGTGT